MADQKQKAEKILQGDASPSSFLSLLNGFGIFSSVLLGALYVLTRKEQIASEATIESKINGFHCLLRKELVDVYKKAEGTTHDLNEEKKVVASLNKELLELEKQILSDKESRKSLGMDLEEATKSLGEINQNALLLSRELEMTKSQISSLEDENHVMYSSLVEQKQLSQEARENMEDAHSFIMKLGMEKENFGNRAKKLEEELALAKGEILRLRSLTSSSRALVNDHDRDEGISNFPSRSQTNSSRDPVNDRNHQIDEGGNNAPFSGKKFSSRRKGNPQRDKF